MHDTDDRALDIAIAQMLGWRWVDEGGIRHLRWHDAPGFAAMEAGGEVYPTSLLLHYSGDAAAARLIEDEIERRGIGEAYIWYLAEVIGHPRHVAWSSLDMFALLRATPEQRCRAALRAVGGDQ